MVDLRVTRKAEGITAARALQLKTTLRTFLTNNPDVSVEAFHVTDRDLP